MEQLRRDEKTLTIAHLDLVAKELTDNWRDIDAITYAIAVECLRFFLGNDWVNSSVFKQHKDVIKVYEDGRRFLYAESEDKEEGYRHQERVRLLAELLFNLQHVPNLDHLINDAINGGDDVATFLATLECITLVGNDSLKARVIVPEQQNGKWPDVAITLPSGATMFCEVKAKLDSTDLTDKTIRNSLEKARKQIRKRGMGIVFLRIPESWALRPEAYDLIVSVIKDIFRQSRSLAGVLLRWEVWRSSKAGGRLTEYRSNFFGNENLGGVATQLQELFLNERVRRLRNRVAFRDIATIAKASAVVDWIRQVGAESAIPKVRKLVREAQRGWHL